MIKTMGCVEIYDDFLSEEKANLIIETTEKIDKDQDVSMGYVSAKVGKGHEGGNIRSNKTFELSSYVYTDEMSREYREAVKSGKDVYYQELRQINDLISQKLQIYVNEYTKKYEFPIMFDEGYTMLRYQGGQEYQSHCDYAPHIPRYLSALILLNPADYEGGGTYFEHFDEIVKPEKPSLVLFPSNYAYAHRAMPVIQGSKYAIVTWLGHRLDFDGMPPMYMGR